MKKNLYKQEMTVAPKSTEPLILKRYKPKHLLLGKTCCRLSLENQIQKYIYVHLGSFFYNKPLEFG